MKKLIIFLVSACVCFGVGACASPTTSTPVPTATNTPMPTTTSTPVPTATNTPMPTATSTPVPTPTNTPTPMPVIEDMTLELSENYIEIGDTPKTIYVRVNENGYTGEWTIRFEEENTSIVGCNWEDWQGDLAPLTITAKSGGKTSVKISVVGTDIYEEIIVVSSLPTPTPTPVPVLEDVEIEVSTKEITVGKEPKTIYVKFVRNGYGEKFTYRWEYETDNITCEWGEIKDGKYPVTITGVSSGIDRLRISIDGTNTYVDVKVKCEMPVRANWIHSRNVDYDEANLRHRVFWGFKESENGEGVKESADIVIKIVNDNGEVVYNETTEVDASYYSNWTNSSWDEPKLLGCIYIDDESIQKGTVDRGTLTISAVLPNGSSFKEHTMNIYDLPMLEFSISMPELPISIIDYDYSEKRDKVMEVLELIPEWSSSGSLKIKVKAKMTYNSEGEGSSDYAYIGYKIKDEEGIIVDSGSFLMGSLAVGDIIVETEYCSGDFELGKEYSIELIDTK